MGKLKQFIVCMDIFQKYKLLNEKILKNDQRFDW